jgi:predicted hotdog family 3-hydroxylacyl-ACP dehydratase
MFLDKIPQKIDGKVLAQVIPHSGRMVLLDGVQEWDENYIVCIAKSHCDKDNPLRVNHALSTIHTIEYAAQAASFHAALVSMKAARPLEGLEKFGAIASAFLAIVRDFSFLDDNLDSFGDLLILRAERIMTGPRILQYSINATIGIKELSRGLITLVIEG